MKKLILSIYLMPALAYSKSLEQAARTLMDSTSRLGNVVAPIGIILGGIYLALGKEEGGRKISMAILGIVSILAGPAFFRWLKTIIA